MLRKIRITLAVLMFLAVTLLFLDFTGALHAWLDWTVKIQFLPAVMALHFVIVGALILLTLVFGRVYCSVICPLGIMQDVFSRLSVYKKKRRYRFSYSPEKKILRWAFLAAFIILMIIGFNNIAILVAPYSAYGRIAQNLLSPLYLWGNNLLAYFAERTDSYAFYETDVWIKSVSSLVIAVATLVVVAVLAIRNGRTWCNTVCPVGTVLGFLSRFSLLRPIIDTSKCNSCGLCAKSCKAACINSKEHKIDYSRCVACMDCIDNCHQGAIRYKIAVLSSQKQDVHEQKTVDNDRRNFVTATAALAVAGTVEAQKIKVDGGLAVIEDKKVPKRAVPLVPPGSQSLKNLSDRCTGCQLCVSACPNGVLRPSDDFSSLMQPRMSYERGYCRPECTRCSNVCPAGAILPVDRAEKSSVQIGHAVWVKKNCIVVTDDVDCGNCARHCPNGAIRMVPLDPSNPDSRLVPAVEEAHCIGCGACENLCPARPFSAIYVEGHLVHKTI